MGFSRDFISPFWRDHTTSHTVNEKDVMEGTELKKQLFKILTLQKSLDLNRIKPYTDTLNGQFYGKRKQP